MKDTRRMLAEIDGLLTAEDDGRALEFIQSAARMLESEPVPDLADDGPVLRAGLDVLRGVLAEARRLLGEAERELSRQHPAQHCRTCICHGEE